ncbi:hypothetical protein GCM10012290_16920 [Halolactibacillus alkaliphilus]|uniref:DUF3221 domain-containing protein n=1 Tax=Halolactibacillus alkaliphilus TaxID=442899 RepID=A0A511X233_9BACI|nr:DUF3221 domain-containing protein [Halolactibacillus alkaliphilus]GEN57009.1 hypothetical protein HAL01_14730 [Halolactibacillus alkaliphilus]GGN71692.1 hypothetical protein GCM10012290_16920 [Halolactibacillus alkaliphilus]SFO85151.1 Protein of unknown function [Halolactibacillus alkaliphilus]
MKKTIGMTLFIIISMTCLSLCIYFKQTPADLTGYVIKKTPERLLIQSEKSKDLRRSGGRERYYELIWVETNSSSLELGDHVDVWYHSISQHYPRIASTKKIAPVNQQSTYNSRLSKKKVIKKVYSGLTTHPSELFVIDQISYIKDKEEWQIDLFDVFSERCQSITIADHT